MNLSVKSAAARRHQTHPDIQAVESAVVKSQSSVGYLPFGDLDRHRASAIATDRHAEFCRLYSSEETTTYFIIYINTRE